MFTDIIISTANAQTAPTVPTTGVPGTPVNVPVGAPAAVNPILQFLPFIFIFAIMYFLIIRPQQKRLKAHREMVTKIKRGDTVVTAGGLIGKVARVAEDELMVDFGEGTKARVVKATVAEVRAKAEPFRDTPDAANDDTVDVLPDDGATDTPSLPANGYRNKPGQQRRR